MIDVWCVYWGDKYSTDYVYRLQDMVAKRLSLEHRFVCLSEQRFDGIESVKPISDKPGWWQKIDLFEVSQGPSMYLDLDVILTGSLDGLAGFIPGFGVAMPLNWAKSGHGGYQSSFMAWEGPIPEVRERFSASCIGEPQNGNCGYYNCALGQLWGDQEWLTAYCWQLIRPIPYGEIVSYKYHCQAGPPEGAKVCVFHGKPDPHEVNDEWVKRNF